MKSGIEETVEEVKMSKEAKTKALKEIKRLENTAAFRGIGGGEHIRWLRDVPWQKRQPTTGTLSSDGCLNEDHYGLEEVKERIIDLLPYGIFRKMGPICAAGPPGVGKTSLGMSVAHALDASS